MSDTSKNTFFIFLAVAVAAVLLLLPWQPGPDAKRTAAIATVMAILWMTEAIPIPATALLPIALFPALGIVPIDEIVRPYAHHYIFLFIGGFFLAMAMKKWDLHRRIALFVMGLFGNKPAHLLSGFMLSTAFLSMWISNTATTMMMVPIALGVLDQMQQKEQNSTHTFGWIFMLAIAYAASVGGMATLVGTPPNIALQGVLEESGTHESISFASWLQLGLPVAVFMLFLLMCIFIYIIQDKNIPYLEDEDSILQSEWEKLGPIQFEEVVVLTVFLVTACLWMTRSSIDLGTFVIPGWSSLFPHGRHYLHDASVAMTMSLILFFIPAVNQKNDRILDWEWAQKIPWGIVLLFGGGFALATGFEQSGLSQWIGHQFTRISPQPYFIVPAICIMMTFLTELTSNTATTNIFLPVLASIAAGSNLPPLLLMLPATLSASCAFMLPVATPPNAIAFGSEVIPMRKMVKTGFFINIIGMIVISVYVMLII